MKKNSFVEGAVIVTLAVIFTKILGMLYVIPFYSIIGSQGGALYSYAYNIYAIFLGISGAGIPAAMSKIISEYNALGMKEAKLRTFNIAKKIIGYLSVIAFIVMFLFADVMAGAIIGNMTGGNSIQDIAFVIRCISIAILVIPYLSVTKGYIQGHSIMTPTSIGSILEQVVRIFVLLCGSFLAYKVFSLSLSLSVGIAVTGAFFGGLAADLYLLRKIKTNKKALGIENFKEKDKVSDKDIIKKIFSYAIPFIIINIATSIYNFTDMVLVIRGLGSLGFSTMDAEFIQSAITTWSNKICMIVNSFAMGMCVSLVPNIVSSYVKKEWKELSTKINKAYQIILIISIPCAIGLCILSKPIWQVFYGSSVYGPQVLAIMVISAIFANLYSTTFNTMQSLNKFKTVYLSVFLGFGANALLDIPLMYLCKYLGLPPFWGATLATITGYMISMAIAVHELKKIKGMSFNSTMKMFMKILVPTIAMIIVVLLVNAIIPFSYTGKLDSIIMIASDALIGGITYVLIAYKMGLFQSIFGKEYINKIIKKLTFGKVSLSD